MSYAFKDRLEHGAVEFFYHDFNVYVNWDQVIFYFGTDNIKILKMENQYIEKIGKLKLKCEDQTVFTSYIRHGEMFRKLADKFKIQIHKKKQQSNNT